MPKLRLIIGNCNYSSWSLRPWFFLAHHGIEFETSRVSLVSDSMEQDLKPFFSDGKVPVLRHGDQEVWDSLAILEYLAELFPDYHGWPAEMGARAVARAVSAEMHSSFSAIRNQLPMNCRRRFSHFRPSSAAARDIIRLGAVWRFCRQRYGREGPWLFGRFSLADCMYAPVVMRLESYGIELDEIGGAYVDTLYNSPAAQAWVALGKAEKEVIPGDEVDWPSTPI